MSEETRKTGRGKRLTDDEKLEIAQMIEQGLNMSEIIQKSGCTRPTIIKYAKMFGIEIKGVKSKNKEPEIIETTIPSIPELMDQFIEVDTDTVLSVGLCDGRHDMKVNTYIFDNINSKTMFNYDEQLNTCLDFIDEHIKFVDGKASKRMVVYTTGLNCLNASIIKACYLRKVNLTLKHYNNSTSLYNSQIMFDDFDVSYYKMIDDARVKRLVRDVPAYIEKDVDDIFSEKEFYIIEYVVDEKRSRFIIKDSKLAWNVFQQVTMCKEMIVGKVSIFLDICSIDKKIVRKNLAKSYNFKEIK